MYFPRNLTKNDMILALTGAAIVLISGLAMNRMSAGPADIAGTPGGYFGHGEVVSQNAMAPNMRPDSPAIAAAACPVSLDLLDEGNAMVGGTLLAPCLPSQDLVIAHAGMVYSAKTLASGALFFSLPALKTPAKVDIRFSSGETASAELPMPDALQTRRVAVQWPSIDGFAIHAFQDGAEFGGPGHIWPENARAPAAEGGYLLALGDGAVQMPLMAQVYTYSAAPNAELLLEAAVTPETCGQELMGDVLSANRGAVQRAEVTLAMPDCDAVGEFVQMPLPEVAVDLALVN